MSVEIISRDTASAKMLGKELTLPFGVNGEMHKVKVKVTGSGSPTRFDKPLGEMSTPADLYNFVQKSVIDMARGFLRNPVLYKDIYREVNDPTLSRFVNVIDFIGMQLAFTALKPGESVPLASFKTGNLTTAEIVTYGAGYAILRDWIQYNEAYKVAQAQEMLGFAFNGMLNNLYLGPIIAADYTGNDADGKAKTSATNADATLTYREKVRTTIQTAIRDALARRNPVTKMAMRPTIALCDSVTADIISEVINNKLTEKGSEYQPLSQIHKTIAYDGASVTVAGKTYSYAGPTAKHVFLIQPLQGFVELIKEDLTPLTQAGDVLKLADEEKSFEFMRGIIADTANSVQKVIIP